MKQRGISLIGLTGLTIGILALVTWLHAIQPADGENDDPIRKEPEPFTPSESISAHQAVAFPTDI